MRLFTIVFFVVFTGGLAPVRADEFDNYTNPVLEKVPNAPGVLKVNKLTPKLLAEHVGVLKGTTAALVVVRTNEDRWARMLVYPAKQKVAGEKSHPILLIDRFVTFKEGEERTIVVQGQNVRLFGGFQFNLDIGQVVPVEVGGDLRFVVSKDGTFAEPVGKAELYLVTKPLPGAKPDVSPKVAVGDSFSPQYYNGIFKLYDDGRRSGTLHLTVREDRAVLGHFFSDKDGKKYEVNGKVSNPPHKVQFKVFYPRTVQEFHGWMFTGDAKAFTGWARMENQETGFYALRREEEKPEKK